MVKPRSRSATKTRSKPAAARPRKAAAKRAPRAAAARKSAPVRAAAARKPAPARAARAPQAAPPAAAANAIGLVNHHLDYTSHDMDAIQRFYVELLGFSQSQRDPEMNYLYVQTGPSSSLGFMPPMPGPPEQWRPPREPALYFIVSDVDAAHRELATRGVSFDQPPMDMPWGHRVAVLRDPEGRRVCLAQNLRR
jgi:predicted enzyme related to lactoylglutathione lyase